MNSANWTTTPLAAVFIDFENIYISTTQEQEQPPNWKAILQFARSFGRVVLARAYADWSTHASAQPYLQSCGIDLVHVPTLHGKNAADIRLIIDAIDASILSNPQIQVVVLATGDSDFSLLARYLRAHGKVVIGIGLQQTTSSALIQTCDRFVFYHTLLNAPAGDASTNATAADPQVHTVVEQYLKALSEKIRMTPSSDRPKAILAFYRFAQAHQGQSLASLYQQFPDWLQQHHPDLSPYVGRSVVHQLFHTYCFEFLPPEREQLWDREVRFHPSIRSGAELLQKCDRGLLALLKRNLPGETIDPLAATILLYGSSHNPRTLNYVRELIAQTQ